MTLQNGATIDQIIAQIKEHTGGNQYAELVSQLQAKGVTLTGNETMYDLVQKVGNIQLGKKVASGTATSDNAGRGTVAGLQFTPSLVFLYASGNVTSTRRQEVGIITTIDIPYHNGSSAVTTNAVRYYNQSGTYGGVLANTNASIQPDGFNFAQQWAAQEYTWIAIE